jgi:protein-disulfide isomerase
MRRTLVLGGIAALALSGAAAWYVVTAAQEKSAATGAGTRSDTRAHTASARRVLAVVGGQPIYDEDVRPQVEDELRRLRNQEYELLSEALEAIIQDRLFVAEAGRRGVTVEKLLAEEVDAKAAEVTEAEARQLYDAQRERIGRPFEEVRELLLRLMRQARVREARARFADSLRPANEVVVLLRPPKVEIAADPARRRGPADAPVLIIEFSDYQCPFCRSAQATVARLLEKYGDRLAHSVRDYPLDDIHPAAQSAAEAARCAAELGRFWEYHALLFANFGKLDRATLLAHARSLALDEAAFTSCLESGKYADAIRRDAEEAARAGVRGTPAFFINGIPLFGAQPIEEFEKIIDAELAALAYSSRNR